MTQKNKPEETTYAETPLMKQYYDIKSVHPDAILLFRVGDFYETFGDDAIKASRILGITLTRRANGSGTYIPLAGFPYHALDTYLPKLVRSGERVAICEQLEDPKTTKKIVKRGVTELITPGVLFYENILDLKNNTFLASVCFGKKNTGIAILDASTGEFLVAEGTNTYIDKLIANFAPKEIIFPKSCREQFEQAFGKSHYTYQLEDWMFSPERNAEKLMTQLEVKSLKGFGVSSMESAVTAAGAIIYYLDFTEHKNVKHITTVSRIDEDKYVWIDKFSIRNLELFSAGGSSKAGFDQVIDRTVSPMGARMLRRWISLPLQDFKDINARLDNVEYFISAPEIRTDLALQLSLVGDVERIVSKISVLRVTPREIVQLKNALFAVEKIKDIISSAENESLAALGRQLDPCAAVRDKIAREIFPDPSAQIQKGGVIAEGVSVELDDLRNTIKHSKKLLDQIQETESASAGIPMKISFNNVFGYYIEVRNTHKDKVPPNWIRKQTLVNAERYITEELKEYEEKIVGAEEKMLVIEARIFAELISDIMRHITQIQTNAQILARIDCLLSFACVAIERNYCRPVVTNLNTIDIKAGRHPVIESILPPGEEYIPNDVYLDDSKQQIMMITGPNMSGKSALLRQTALIVLMAQIGCYVPAAQAEIGIVDKIFTRVGASDNILQGESTFMVEMLESASILNNISGRSLVLLDEIGRGTSTYDGISIAWAMVEYLHNHPKVRAKTLFATHYHELNDMENQFERIKNYNVSVKEVDKNVVFLRKLMRGGTQHSFGIHVAKMAGMPQSIVSRADKILREMEESRRAGIGACAPQVNNMQLSMFQLEDPVLKQIRDEIRDMDLDSLTPLEALNKLSEIKKITGL